MGHRLEIAMGRKCGVDPVKPFDHSTRGRVGEGENLVTGNFPGKTEDDSPETMAIERWGPTIRDRPPISRKEIRFSSVMFVRNHSDQITFGKSKAVRSNRKPFFFGQQNLRLNRTRFRTVFVCGFPKNRFCSSPSRSRQQGRCPNPPSKRLCSTVTD